MAIAVGDIIQISDVQSYLGQLILNVYFYRIVSFEAAVDLQVITNAWQTQAAGPIAGGQQAGLVHERTIAKNLSNGIDILEDVWGLAGSQSGEGLASFYALGFRLVRSTALTRHGSKRIAGIPEAFVNGNSLVNPAGTTYAAAVVGFIGADLVVSGTLDNDFVAEPVIVGRFPQGDPNAGELDLSKINPILNAQFIRVTTQTTRRAGRGA